MSKINQTLKTQIKKKASDLYDIIVVTSEPLSAKTKLNKIEGLDNIYTGTLSGTKILELEKNKKVVSIEVDGESGVFG